MKKSFIILFFAFNFYGINTSNAQKTISLTTATGAGYDLNKFSKIDVISNLPDSNNLGYIPALPESRPAFASLLHL